MKAVGYKTPGSLDRDDALVDTTLDDPVATGRDLLVRVKAVSVNPVDFKVRANRAPEGEEWGANVLRLPFAESPLIVQAGFPGVLEALLDAGYNGVKMAILHWSEVEKLQGSLTCGLCVLQVPESCS